MGFICVPTQIAAGTTANLKVKCSVQRKRIMWVIAYIQLQAMLVAKNKPVSLEFISAVSTLAVMYAKR
jgi:hypothetical protein